MFYGYGRKPDSARNFPFFTVCPRCQHIKAPTERGWQQSDLKNSEFCVEQLAVDTRQCPVSIVRVQAYLEPIQLLCSVTVRRYFRLYLCFEERSCSPERRFSFHQPDNFHFIKSTRKHRTQNNIFTEVTRGFRILRDFCVEYNKNLINYFLVTEQLENQWSAVNHFNLK